MTYGSSHMSWPTVPLGSVARVVGGSTPDSGNTSYWGGDIVWVTPADLGQLETIHVRDSGRRITRLGFLSTSIDMLPVNSVILSSRAPIGYLAINDVPLCTNQGCKSFVPGASLDTRYLFYFLKRAVPALRELGSGATFAEVSKSKLENYPIPVPPLPEQQRIVAKLDEQMATLDRAEKALAEQQAAASVLVAATLQQIFSGCESKRWRTLPIGDLCQASVSTWDTSAHPQEQKRYIEIAGIDPTSKTIGNTHFVQACTAPSRARNVVHTGDIIIATTRPNLNAVAVVPPDLDNQVCSTGFAVLRPNELIISRWLYWSVRSPDFIRTVSDLVVGAMYPAVTDKQVKSVVIPVPPIPEQECLVARLDQQTVHLGLVLRALEDQDAELAALRSTLLDAAFSGEV